MKLGITHTRGYPASDDSTPTNNTSSTANCDESTKSASNNVRSSRWRLMILRSRQTCSSIVLTIGFLAKESVHAMLSSLLFQGLLKIALFIFFHQVLASHHMLWSQSIWLPQPLTMIRPVDYSSNTVWQNQATSYDIVYRIVKKECAELCVRKDLTPYSIKFGRMACGKCAAIGYSVFNRVQHVAFGPFGLMKVKVYRKKAE
jgi:hypothetical protein